MADPAKTNYKLFLAKVGYLESPKLKIRPVIILTKPKGSYNIMMAVPISSKSRLEEVDVRLKDWQSSRLEKPSVALVHRLSAIVGQRVLEEVGQLSDTDNAAIQQAVRQLFSL